MKRAIVLSGGGAKGAYEIGVFKAIRKLGIHYDIVTGTSVGALNGVLFVQHDYRKGKKLWSNMNFNVVFNEDVLEKYHNARTTADMALMFSSNYIKHGGMAIDNLENAVRKVLKPKKFFRSSVDFSISTYNLTKNQALKLKKCDLTDENVLDYVLASSSCYPAIQKRKIGSNYYIDGGVFDNLPINSAIDLGADEVIAVDLKAPGLKEKVKDKTIPITTISPNNNIGNFLNFNGENARRAIKYGYFDTLKVYHKLEGETYTFYSGQLKKNNRRYQNKMLDNLNKVFDYIEGKNRIDEIIRIAAFKRITSINKKNHDKVLDDIIEYLGHTFEIDDCKCYRSRKLNKLLLLKLDYLHRGKDVNINEISKLKILDLLNTQKVIQFFYWNIGKCERDYDTRKYISKLALTFPKEFLGALYLYTVRKRGFLW